MVWQQSANFAREADLIDWPVWLKPAVSALIGAKSTFGKVRDLQPTADFAPTAEGPVLHIKNVRLEAIIV